MWNLCAGLCTLGVSASGCFFELADPVSTGGQGGVGATGGEVGNGGGGKGGGSGGGTGDGGGGNGAQGGMATGGGGAGGSVSAYAAEVIADGAIAYYRLNETRGAVAQDAVGSFNAAIVGGVTFGAAGAINGDPDTAFELLAGGLGLGTMQPIDSVTPWTVEAWVHPTALDATASRIFDITDAGPMRTGHTWFIRNDGTAGNIQGGYERWLNGSISCATHSTDQIAVGEYSHLVLTFDGQNARLYYNGVNVVTSNPCPALPNLNGQFFFGRAQNGGSTLDGQFDELAIYDSALSAAQITSHYSYGQR